MHCRTCWPLLPSEKLRVRPGRMAQRLALRLALPTDISSKLLRTHDNGSMETGVNGDCHNPLVPTGIAGACEVMRADENKQAPPGFEPGMADLQSAAFPLG